MVTVRRFSFVPVTRPLKVTFATTLGRKDVLKSYIARIALSDGTEGLGEVPTSHAVKDETFEAIGTALRDLRPLVEGLTEGQVRERLALLRKRYARFPMTLAGLETALFRAFLFSKGLTEYTFWGVERPSIESDITIPLLPDEGVMGRWVQRALRAGFRCLKVKMGGVPETDKRSLDIIRQAVGRNENAVRLRLDGNQGFSVGTFLAFCDFLAEKGYPVELFEQPLPKEDLKGLKKIRGRTPFPIILDEAVFTSEELRRVLDAGTCEGVNIKIAKSGLQEAAQIHALARQAGIRIMMGCMTETMVGLSAAIYFAAGRGGIDFIDLDAIHFLHHRRRFGNIMIDGPAYVLKDAAVPFCDGLPTPTPGK